MRFSRNSAPDQIEALKREGEERDAERRAAAVRIPYLKDNLVASKDAVIVLEEENARAANLAVVARDDKKLTVLAETAKDDKTKEAISSLKKEGFDIDLFITTKTKLRQAWEKYPRLLEETNNAPAISEKVELEADVIEKIKSETETKEEIAQFFTNIDPEATTSVLLGSVLGAALALRASDVHIEIDTKKKALVRLRIDGELRDVGALSEKQATLLVGRIKLLAGLKLNIRDAAQDGRFTIESAGGPVEVRASVVPAEFGEAVVLRVLDPATISLELKDLGLRHDDEEIIEKELKRPNGMILVTGPTGSGKTTTLYAFLKKLHTQTIKIITIEDPIEYHVEGVEQTQTDKKNNYTFASGLRAILRQDPDVILIGEIRDTETAQVGIDAALTGHLVLSTLHTNSAAGAIPRIIDLGVRPATIGPAVSLVVAQRLVRTLCESCKRKVDINEELRAKIEKFRKGLPKRASRESMEESLYEARGCDKCEEGFRGRIAIAELLTIGEEIDSLIKSNATEGDIEKMAREKQEMVLMQEDGIIKALRGKTTLSEVERATGPIEW